MTGDVKAVLRDAEQRGWQITLRRGGHLKLVHPSGAICFASKTPSDHRTGRNLACLLRRLERDASHV